MDVLDGEFKTKLPCFLIYRDAARDIDAFVQVTKLSYLLTGNLLDANPKASLVGGDEIPVIQPREFISHSPADDTVTRAELFGWVDFAEYAELAGLSTQEVEALARAGQLGRVRQHPESQQDLVIWPPAEQLRPEDSLPRPGDTPEYLLRVTFRGTAPINLADLGEGIDGARRRQSLLLKLVHQLGEPRSVVSDAQDSLLNSGFLLHWTAFEVFLQATVTHMLRKHPEKIKRKRGGQTVGIDEIMSWSDNLTSIERFRENLIEHELIAMQTEGRSVHGIINYLKERFSFERDPYEADYTCDRRAQTTSYTQLLRLKDIRNILVHEGDQPSNETGEGFEYEEAVLILKTIAHHIGDLILREEYSAR